MLDGSGRRQRRPASSMSAAAARRCRVAIGREVRLDIDPQHKPDIVASMVDIPDDIGQFTLVYSSHSLEHLYPHEVHRALRGSTRVLVPNGICIAIVPDLQDIRRPRMSSTNRRPGRSPAST